jgi:hypothetical protein
VVRKVTHKGKWPSLFGREIDQLTSVKPNELRSNRQHLARDIVDLRRILRSYGYGDTLINQQLRELIRQNKALGGFDK